MSMDQEQLDLGARWTLFVDRDGVINRRIVGGYVRTWSEWEWIPGAREAFERLSARFGRIFVVTNQQGIAKGLMTEADLAEIHRRMVLEIEGAGGRIDGVYHCPHAEAAGCDCRKPRPGLVHLAQSDFPGIDLSHSIVLGDSASDMELAFAVGARAVFVGQPPEGLEGRLDANVTSLAHFSEIVSGG